MTNIGANINMETGTGKAKRPRKEALRGLQGAVVAGRSVTHRYSRPLDGYRTVHEN